MTDLLEKSELVVVELVSLLLDEASDETLDLRNNGILADLCKLV